MNIYVYIFKIFEIKLLYEFPGGNLVDGLPPAAHTSKIILLYERNTGARAQVQPAARNKCVAEERSNLNFSRSLCTN